jgi:histone H3/H4
MTKKPEFIKFNTIKKYINEVKQMRASTDAIEKLIKEFDSTIEAVITASEKTAKEDKRTTIMEQDIITALEKHLGKKHLTWEEIQDEIIRQTPADLGKISKSINDYIEKEQKK